jgi:hypothetical protein
VSDDIGELVRALPAAVLWALLGIAAIAIGLAANAFWQSRQRAALEIQRAELLDDIGLLSRALLPPIPEALDGLAVSAAYRPADGPAAGGDFYDVFTVSEQRICILLGDVSGHGRESVTQAALARYTLRTLLAAGHAPGEALARADELLARDLRPNFVTVIAGVYDPGTSEFTYAKAGHAPPIILGAEHDPDAERPVPPIGLRVGDTWPEYRMRLCEGVSICLFTDGLEDARIGDARVGRDQIARLLAAQVVPDAERLLGDLEHLADRRSPEPHRSARLAEPRATLERDPAGAGRGRLLSRSGVRWLRRGVPTSLVLPRPSRRLVHVSSRPRGRPGRRSSCAYRDLAGVLRRAGLSRPPVEPDVRGRMTFAVSLGESASRPSGAA